MKHGLITNNALRGPLYREAVRRGAGVLPYGPFVVYLDPCNACNLKCTFCPQSSWGRRERGRMPMDVFEQAIREIIELRPHRLYLFAFGEPTLHPQIASMVRTAVAGGLNVRINTNAAALTDEKIDELVSSGLQECCFSFDTADPEQYEAMRVGSDFETTLRNIRSFDTHRRRLGSRTPKLILQELVPYRPGEEASNSDAYRALFEGCDVDFRAKFMHSFAGQGTERDFETVRDEGRSCCNQLYRRIVVNFDGKIHACCLDPEGYNIVGDLTAGDSIASAWNGPRMAEMRERTSSGDVAGLKPCDQCDMLTRRPRKHPPLKRLLAGVLWRIAARRPADP